MLHANEQQLKRIRAILDESQSDASDKLLPEGIVGSKEGIFISYDTMARIVDLLRTREDKNNPLFEDCWAAYRRKGSKKKAKEYWNKLTDKEMDRVLPHIRAYVSSREVKYQKDFERYLRDKTFDTVVYNGNNIVYDPTKSIDVADTNTNVENEGKIIINGQEYR